MKKFLFLSIIVTGFVFVSSFINNSISPGEAEGILLMREEEKLARDVYEQFYAMYNTNPFGHIRFSEQNHMDRMLSLVEQFNLNDPVGKTKDAPGIFVNERLQRLYNKLMNKGKISFVNALEVGAEVEEVDIADLDKEMASTSNPDILNVYRALRQASHHHLSAYAHNLKMRGVEYKPMVLKQQQFDRILSENTMGRSNGNGMGMRKKQNGDCGAAETCCQNQGSRCVKQ